MKNNILIIAVLAISITGFTQTPDSTTFKRHELGMSWNFRAGRLVPGIQYYYSIKPGQQIGAGFNMLYTRNEILQRIFAPEFSLSYRWRWDLYKGLNAFVEPMISYGLMTITGESPRHFIGAGVNTGMEYDFSKNTKAPLILGFGIKTMGIYSKGHFTYNLTPSVSLRFKL